MSARKQKGYKYPTGRLNSMAKAYFGGKLTGGKEGEDGTEIDPLDEMGDFDPSNNEEESITPALSGGGSEARSAAFANKQLPSDPVIAKPSHWDNIVTVLTKGLIRPETAAIKNQLEMQKYNFELQKLIGEGKLDAARQLAEAKGKADLIKMQQEKADAIEIENLKSKNTLTQQDNQNLGTRGYIGPDALNTYRNAGGYDKTITGDRSASLENQAKINLLNTSSGAEEFTKSLIEKFREGGIANKLGISNANFNDVKAKTEPFKSVGNNSLVNVLDPSRAFTDVGNQKKPIMIQVGDKTFPSGEVETTPSKVIGVNAIEGTQLVPRLKAAVVPTTNEVMPTLSGGGGNNLQEAPVQGPQLDDEQFFELLLNRLRKGMVPAN